MFSLAIQVLNNKSIVLQMPNTFTTPLKLVPKFEASITFFSFYLHNAVYILNVRLLC